MILNEGYIFSFLERNSLAILSTVNLEGKADAAPIYFVADDNFDVFFITPVKTRKNTNLGFQKDVVLTVTDPSRGETVQIRGNADEDKEKGVLQKTLNRLAQKLNETSHFVASLPPLKHKNNEKIVVRVKPYEIRMRRYTEENVEEETIRIPPDGSGNSAK